MPRALDGLLVAGRHVSSDAASHSFLREIPQCWLTGQAAGAAAGLAAGLGVAPRAVPIGALQAELLRQGAFVRVPAEAANCHSEERSGDQAGTSTEVASSLHT